MCVFFTDTPRLHCIHTSVTRRCCINAYQANSKRLRFHAGYANTPIGQRSVEMKPFWVCLYVSAWNSCSWGNSTFSNYYGLTVKSLCLEIMLKKKKKKKTNEENKLLYHHCIIVWTEMSGCFLDAWESRTPVWGWVRRPCWLGMDIRQ